MGDIMTEQQMLHMFDTDEIAQHGYRAAKCAKQAIRADLPIVSQLNVDL